MKINGRSQVQPTNQPQAPPQAKPVTQPRRNTFEVSAFDATKPSGAGPGGDANANLLLGLKRGAGTPAQIKQLQDDLVSLGFLDASVKQNVGYGNTFGPMTETAVRQLQQARGLPVTGVVDAATVKTLLPPVATNPGPTLPPAQSWPGASAGDSAAASLAGLQKDGGTPAQVKQLQDDLSRMGYLPNIQANAGYGKHFGELTDAAVKQFQKENGLPQTGQVDAATAQALQSPRPRPAGPALGAAETYRSELGLPTGPLETLADGSKRQSFDRGYVMQTPDGTLFVNHSDGTQIAPPAKPGTASSVEQANQSFVSQWGPTPWNSAQGAPYGYEDCGPTSVTMTLSALGLIAHPAPGDAETTIDHMRDLAIGKDTTHSQLTGDAQLERALSANGAQTQELHPPTLDSVDAALASGHPLIVGSSKTWDAWGKAQSAAGDYLNYRNPGGHYVTILGKTADGQYIVADPLSKTGARAVSAEQVKTLLSGAWDAIEVSRK